ncbi:MAG: sterol desaturase family protein [Novosphingobium sp.]|nr:sterol desaturase family protein [Novosphingobium sp.]
MNFIDALVSAAMGALPAVIAPLVIMIPYIAAEQLWPAVRRPRAREYGFNIVLAFLAIYLTLPAGVAAGMLAESVRGTLPWRPLAFSFSSIGQVPYAGGVLEIAAMIFVPLFVRDAWFYWSHRIEHRVPMLWEFHKLHHSDPNMNCTTWARDHVLQNVWRSFFPIFTLGLISDLHAVEAGQAAIWSGLFLMLLSMLYHSAIRLRLPWFDRVVVTPQVHRIHHSRDPAHYNCNFADALPLFDIVFGTYRKPGRDEFAETGLGESDPPPRNIWRAVVDPAVRGFRHLV